MEKTWLWIDVSSLYGWASSTGWVNFDIFSAAEEESNYAKEKSRIDMSKYFNNRSSLRKALRSWEKSTWNKDVDKIMSNKSLLADGIMNVMIARWKEPEYMKNKYWNKSEDLIEITKSLEWWRYASDIDAFISSDWSNLTWTLSKIFPDTVSKMQDKEYKQPEKEEKGRWWRFVENFMWYMPKVAESANDVWNLIKLKTWATDERSIMFWNYIYDKYWQSIDDVPTDKLDKDYKEFMALSGEKKKEYMPTWTWTAVKWVEWVTDTVITATPWWAVIKWLLSATWATPWLNLVNEGIWMAVGWLWWLVNQVPWLSNIRDNLQSEKEKQERDAFVGWVALQKATKAWKVSKNLKTSDFTEAFETYKKSWFNKAFKELSDKAAWKSEAQLKQKKSNKAQEIIQPENEAKLQTSEQWLDTVSKSKDISKIRSVDELSKAIDEEINSQKSKQMEAAKWEDVTISSDQLLDKTPSKLIWWKERARATAPVTSMLDLLIDYYKDVDVRMADKYKSYKSAIEGWTIKLSDLLELKRDANSWGQWLYDKMWNPIDSKLAWKFNVLREWFNKVIDWLEWWENLRKTDKTLSWLYDLKTAIDTIKKEAFKEKWRATTQSTLWKVLWRMANWLMFGAWDVLKRVYASFMQEVFKVEPKKMSSLEISNKIPELLKDYKDTQTRLQRAKNLNEAKWIFNKFAKQRWLWSRDEFKLSFEEQKAWTPKWILFWEYNDEGRERIWNYFWKLEDNKEEK